MILSSLFHVQPSAQAACGGTRCDSAQPDHLLLLHALEVGPQKMWTG
jgi:hypothetical protein